MSAEQYLQMLIDGQKISSIPVQLTELLFLQKLMEEQKTS